MTTSSATAFEAADGVQDIVFRGNHTDTSVTIDDNAAGSFTVTTATGAFTGSLATTDHDGSTMSNSAVVTLTNATTTDKIDIILDMSYDVDLTKAAGTLALSGTNNTSFTFKVGTGVSSTADDISVTVNSVSAASLSIDTTSVDTASNANTASVAVSNAIDDLQNHRATIGANQNRLEFAAANIATATENTEAARSQLLDLDIAAEMSNFVSKQILIQAGVSMLAQANQLPNNLLRLFQ